MYAEPSAAVIFNEGTTAEQDFDARIAGGIDSLALGLFFGDFFEKIEEIVRRDA